MSLFNGIKWPYATMQQLNLDWILTEIKRVLGFFPESGDPGTVLMKTEDGTAWEELEAVDININGVPEDTELTDTDKLIFYDVSSSANRKITAPNLLNSMMSNGTPLMDGTGSAGTSKKPARYDHRHPTDTSRAPASYFQNNVLKFEHGGLNDSGAGYCKMPDGTLIQWGTATIATGTKIIHIYFPKDFIDTAYCFTAIASIDDSANVHPLGYYYNYVGDIRVYAQSNVSEDLNLLWVAIGRRK